MIADQGIASKLFDPGVNSSYTGSIRSLQQIAGVEADGILGPNTANAINALDPKATLDQFKLAELQRYREIEAKHPEWAKNFKGWEARVLR